MKLSPAQNKVAQDNKRFRVCIAGRRFGKTFLAIRELAYHARIPDQEVIYVSPSYKMSKNIVWRKLKNKLQDLNWVQKHNETELKLELKNGSTISLKGADNYDSLRGTGNHFIVLDEFADIDPEAWFEVLRPTLADTGGKALFIGTPKGIGNWSYELYQYAQEDPQAWSSYQFSTVEGGNVPESEIEQARKDLDSRTFRQEFLATFETYSGRIYYAFDRKENVRPFTDATPDLLYIGIDFNVDPLSAVVIARQGDQLHVIDEIRMFSSNTQEAVDEIKSRYPKAKIWAYPDPAGTQRRSSAGGLTDHIILRNNGFVVKAPNAHTPVRDRINAVNSRLCDATGQRHLYVDPRCKYTIEGLERHSYKPGTSQPEKGGNPDYSHQMDALGYAVDYLFPVRRDIDPKAVRPQRFGHALA